MEERFRTFTVLITKISRDIRKIKTEEMREFGLGNMHVSCLYYLYKEKYLSAKQLSDICLEDKAAISRAISYLENKGFVSCESTYKKRYNSALSLTDSGVEIAKKVAAKIDRILDFAGEDISDKERKNMYEGLVTISNNLDKYCGKYSGGNF